MPDVRAAAPRPVEIAPDAAQRYPSARDLVTGSDAWRSWLDDALRCVLGPAAIAGALGVAAAGCALPGVALDPFGTAADAKSGAAKPPSAVVPVVTFAPLGPPSVPQVAPTLTNVVIPSVQPPSSPLTPPRRPPARNPPMMRGGARRVTIDPPARPVPPAPDPPQIEGGLALVRPSS